MSVFVLRPTSAAVLIALSSLTGSVLADEVSELKSQLEVIQKRLNQVEAKQQSAATTSPAAATATATDKPGGSLPRSWRIPGTDTSIRLGGYIKIDGFYDRGPGLGDAPSYAAIPLNGTAAANRDKTVRINARETRITIATETPTGSIKVGTYLEADFYGAGGTETSTNAAGLRLRKAYISAGGFLLGQENTVMIDPGAIPETVDFTGPAGRPYLRVPQLRYATTLGPGLFTLALENPESDFNGKSTATTSVPTALGSATSGPNADHVPDLTGAVSVPFGWGHLGAQGVLRRISVDTGTVKDSANGYVLGLSGSLKLPNNGGLTAQVITSMGGGRYFSELPSYGASFDGTSLKTNRVWSATLALKHYWTPKLRSNLVYSVLGSDNNVAVIGSAYNSKVTTVHGNLLYAVAPSLDLGAELIYANRQLDDGQQGTGRRLLFSAKYAY